MCLVLTMLACGSSDVQTLQIRGSDSEVNLVQRLGEAFGDDRPDRAVAVTGGGSGVGIAGLIDGNCDLANSSRALKPAEKLLAMRKGVDPVATIFAADALTIIVHPDNDLPSMTLAELAALFTGESTAWPDGEPVVPFGRQSSSGTFGFFRDVVLKADYTEDLRQMNGNAQIVESVARERGGIGYVAVGYLKSAQAEGSDAPRVRALEIRKDEDSAAVSPLDAEAVARGDYPITRPLYQFSAGVPRGTIREFLLFELSETGRELSIEMGFYPPVDEWMSRNAHLETEGP